MVIDYNQAPALLTGVNNNRIIITYTCTDPNVKNIVVGWGADQEYPNAQRARGKSVPIVADGREHTAVLDMSSARYWKGYIRELGIFFDDGQAVGSTITISRIQIVNQG